MFASSILHICVFLVSFGIIKHLNSMRVQEIWKFIHLRVSYSPRAIYSPTSIIFPSGVALRGIWYSWVNKFSYFPLQHAINVYYYLIVKFYMFYKVFFIFNYFWGFGFLVFYWPVTFDLYCDWSKQSDEYLLQIRNLV
jgi:hypothetical protein